jgi:hypothetical protein
MGFEKTVLGCRQRKGIFKNAVRFGKAPANVTAVKFEVRAYVCAIDRSDLGEIGKAGIGHAHGIVH